MAYSIRPDDLFIPQYTDFNLSFTDITVNGGNINISTQVDSWRLVIAKGSISNAPIVSKVANNLGDSGADAADFTVDVSNRIVSVAIRSSGDLSFGHGLYYANLYAVKDGEFFTHRQLSFVIEPTVSRA
jgi:hypothetical protein